MARTDVADVRDTVKDHAKTTASSALDSVKAQAAAAGESLAAEGRKAGRRARKRAQALADEAAKSARKSTKKARKRADKATAKASKKTKKRAHELNVALQEKAGRKPRRGRKAAVLGGFALAGIAVATVLGRKNAAGNDPFPPSPTAGTGSGLPGDPPPTA